MLRAYLPPEQCSQRGPGEILLAHCQMSAPAFAQRPFSFELGKSMRQQHLMCWHPFFVALACQGKVGILNALKQKADSGCRQPPKTRKGTQYCGNLTWIIPAEGSGKNTPGSPG